MTSTRMESPLAPISVVVATLIVLALVPIVVARLQAGPRARMERIMDAQVAVNDLQEALASDGDTGAQLRRDARLLVTDTNGLDASATRDAMRIDAAIEGGVAMPHAAIAAVSRHLEERLEALGFGVRGQLFRDARWNRIVPALLVPLALVSVVLVWGVERRARADAIAAEDGRRAYARAMEEKAALARGVTHDLKNPLSAMLGYVHLLRDGVYGAGGDARRDEALERIERLVQASLASVNGLLEVSRAEPLAEAPVVPEAVDLPALVGALAEDYRASALGAGLALAGPAAVRGAGCTVWTDVHLARRIIENLISNAIKYTPAGGAIMLDVTAHDEACVVTVADTGPGVPPALRERIFEEFYRGPRATAPGAGIGLASSRRIARRLGGDLTVRGRREGGSVFELRLPAAAPETLGEASLSIQHVATRERLDGSSAA